MKDKIEKAIKGLTLERTESLRDRMDHTFNEIEEVIAESHSTFREVYVLKLKNGLFNIMGSDGDGIGEYYKLGIDDSDLDEDWPLARTTRTIDELIEIVKVHPYSLLLDDQFEKDLVERDRILAILEDYKEEALKKANKEI